MRTDAAPQTPLNSTCVMSEQNLNTLRGIGKFVKWKQPEC